MHAVLIAVAAVVGVFGWVWKRFHYAWQDLGSANRRFKGARKVFRHETLWSFVFVVIAVLIVRALV